MEDLSSYEKLKEAAQNHYKSVGKIYSPALGQEINFTAEGFNHIIFKSGGERERSSQILRFKLLPRAIKLIGLSTTYQEVEETIKEFEIKTRKKKTKKTKSVRYWGIIAIIDSRKIKVIVRKIGEGNIHFWSIMPAWITNKYRDTKFYSTMKGDPEED